MLALSQCILGMQAQDIQARSGRVAFPRTKVVPPMDARMEGAARAAERIALVRKRVVAIVCSILVESV